MRNDKTRNVDSRQYKVVNQVMVFTFPGFVAQATSFTEAQGKTRGERGRSSSYAPIGAPITVVKSLVWSTTRFKNPSSCAHDCSP